MTLRALALALLALTAPAACATAPPPAPPTPPTAPAVDDDPDDAIPDAALTGSHEASGPQAGALAPPLDHLVWYRGALPAPGQPYVLFFWGTWCKPCKAALPTLMERAAARGLPIVAVSRDKAPGLDTFFAEWTAPFPDLVAIEAAPYIVHNAYDAWTLPRFFYVGADGRVEKVVYGTRDLDSL